MRTVISFIILIMGCVLPLVALSVNKGPGQTATAGKVLSKGNAANADTEPNALKKLEAGTRILLSFPVTPKTLPFTESQLNRFRSSLGASDQLGIVVSDRRQQLLPMTEEAQVKVPTAKIIEGFHTASPDSDDGQTQRANTPENMPVNIEETIRNAVAQLSDMDGLLKAVVLVLDGPVRLTSLAGEDALLPSNAEPDTAVTDGDAAVTALSTLLALQNIILYAVFPETVSSPPLEKLTEQSGGGNIYLSTRVTLNDALYMAYDSILLRTIQLAPQKALYEGDEVCPAAQTVNDAPAKMQQSATPRDSANTYIITLLIAVLGLVVVLLLLTVVVWQRGGVSSQQQPKESTGTLEAERDNAPPAFSKLTIGINRVRNTFSDMESKLHALSTDLDDFGSENWEMQKKIVSAYAEITKELFLLLDHLTLVKNTPDKSISDEDVQRTDDTDWVIRKIEQALENNGIEEIVPEAGERFHSKYHAHAGARVSEQKAGTVLEVVRNGYQRKGFVSDEPFVLRQAEVIVSSGKEEGN